MFTIRQLYTAIAIAYVLLLLIAIIVLRLLWFFPAEYEAALNQQQSEINGLSAILNLKRDQIEATNRDYAAWDDTYEYINGDNPDYIDDNFIADTFESLHLAAAAIVSSNGSITYSGYYRGDDIETMPASITDWLNSNSDHFLSDQVYSGYQLIGNRTYLISASPVTQTGQDSPSNGWLLFFQNLQSDDLKTLAAIARVQLDLIPPPYPLQNTDITQLLTEVRAVRQGCLLNHAGVATLCVNVQHSNGEGPSRFTASLAITLITLSTIPIALFLFVLNLAIGPIAKATKLLERNKREKTLRPILVSTRIRIVELFNLRNAYNDLMATLRLQQERLEQLSNTDKLTNIPNRRAFETALESSWRRMLRHPYSTALVLVDIDYFKRFNDHYGHQAGDKALHQVAQALDSCARRVDEIACRFGGEEFVLLLQADDAMAVNDIRTRLHQAIKNLHIPHHHSDAAKELTVSIGIAWIKGSGEWLETLSKDEWLRAADTALYEAKAAGRNTSMLQVLSEDIPLTESPVLSQLPDSL